MPRIFDNLDEQTTLLAALRQTLDGAARADVCVGYFNLRGWSSLARAVDNLAAPASSGNGAPPPCRVLVGMQPSGEERIRAAYAIREPETPDQAEIVRMRGHAARAFRQQLAFGIATNQQESALRDLSRQIAEGRVRIKLFLRHPLHAKLYLVQRPDTVAPLVGYLGSSNLTFSGLSNQGELNIDVLDQDAARKLLCWFEDRWRDRWCLDISDELRKIIDTSWAGDRLVPPHHVYLKMAWHLCREAREGMDEFRIPSNFGVELFDFQKAAVKIAARHVHRRGGVLLGDVVGLGKTVMASALARVLQDDLDFETLILCPKNLEQMWLDAVDRHRLRAKVVPTSRVIRDLPNLRRYRTVLIDESHNLRNPEGKTYKAVQDYIHANDCNVILLSATPYNKTFADLGAQLALFVPREQDLGIRPEALLQEIGEPEFARRHQTSPRTLAAFEKSEHAEDWRSLMRRYLVRRTRSFIVDNYAERDADGRAYLPMRDGERAWFPERVPRTVQFAFDADDDPYARLFTPSVVDVIDGLELPRYGLGNYLEPRPTPPPNADARLVLDGLGRAGVRLKGFCRTNLFKRLESSGFAFLQSVERHVLRNFVFVHALENGLDLPIGTQDIRGDTTVFDPTRTDRDGEDPVPDDDQEAGDPDEILPGMDSEAAFRRRAAQVYEGFARQHRNSFRWLPAAWFSPALKRDLLRDAGALVGILEAAGQWDPAADAKLHALVALVRDQHPAEKVLVFSQFADTVAYLADELGRGGVRDVAAATADARNPAELAWRFSPRSNDKAAAARDAGELRVLVATDVLSEGQNLQDAAIIVNYDLPWAIIRLIQRAGRVDRIGQQAERILCYSFLPADGLEAILSLHQRIRDRLRSNAEVVGADEAFFEGDGGDRTLRDLYNEHAGVLDDAPDSLGVDPTSEAYQIWKNAIDADPSLAKLVPALPDQVYTARTWEHPAADRPPGVLVFVRSDDDNDALAWVDDRGAVVTEAELDVLRAAACHPDTPARPRTEAHHALVADGVRQMLDEQKHVGGQLGRPNGARFRTYQRLAAYVDRRERDRGQLGLLAPGGTARPDIDAVKRAVQDIHDRPLRPGAGETLNRLLRSGVGDDDLAQRVTELRDEDKLTHAADATGAAEPRIVCSIGLVAPARDT